MERTELARQMKATSFLTGQFRLRSGKTSPFYFDKYRFESDPILLSAIVDELEKLLPKSFDKLAGMELGGIPLATALSLRTGRKCLYVRKVPKTYGTCNLVEGGFSSGEIVTVIEDVITTAGQVCTSVKQMRQLGLVVPYVVCVIDRQQGGKENLEKIGCSLSSAFSLDELEIF
ncbi:MAG: orotate phosphoribosyltransferase [Candidatus Bathyarchaeota archaeon]|jgi:orotate phosphoribosyltransferase